jgi:REP element-mobilizing transposase RayT
LGNKRREIFRSHPNGLRFLALLREATLRFGWRLHGYVLMPNHYHLLVELAEENLSRAMQWLNSAYGQ